MERIKKIVVVVVATFISFMVFVFFFNSDNKNEQAIEELSIIKNDLSIEKKKNDSLQKEIKQLQAAQSIPHFDNIYFKSQDTITSNSEEEINKLASYLRENPTVKVILTGYSDNNGNLDSKIVVSQKRAEKVKYYLQLLDIDSLRILTFGKADTNPIGDNKTVEGKLKNRRVEIKIIDNI